MHVSCCPGRISQAHYIFIILCMSVASLQSFINRLTLLLLLARPEILLDPPVPSGILVVEEGRSISLACLAGDFLSHPPVGQLISGTTNCYSYYNWCV